MKLGVYLNSEQQPTKTGPRSDVLQDFPPKTCFLGIKGNHCRDSSIVGFLSFVIHSQFWQTWSRKTLPWAHFLFFFGAQIYVISLQSYPQFNFIHSLLNNNSSFKLITSREFLLQHSRSQIELILLWKNYFELSFSPFSWPGLRRRNFFDVS